MLFINDLSPLEQLVPLPIGDTFESPQRGFRTERA